MTYPNNSNQYLPGTIQTPSSLNILAITNARNMVVTIDIDPITEANTYITGQLVRLTIPFNYGMQQANGQTGQVVTVSGNNITLDIDSTKYDVFSVPSGGEQPASLAPSGSRNLPFNNTTSNIIPFKSLNNRGN